MPLLAVRVLGVELYFFTPEIIFITDIIPLRSVFNLCYPYEIPFWK